MLLEILPTKNVMIEEKMELESQENSFLKNKIKTIETKLEEFEESVYQRFVSFKDRNDYEISTLHQKLSKLEIDLKATEKNVRCLDEKKSPNKERDNSNPKS